MARELERSDSPGTCCRLFLCTDVELDPRRPQEEPYEGVTCASTVLGTAGAVGCTPESWSLVVSAGSRPRGYVQPARFWDVVYRARLQGFPAREHGTPGARRAALRQFWARHCAVHAAWAQGLHAEGL